ncbi:hypothetical protein SK128_003106 [Halocaridina rubra]|uniref:Uncharacterized protein n=1 Tax=Halocaridina rubra TaxID=373956 RepID=A0AAN8WIW1_HALRR
MQQNFFSYPKSSNNAIRSVPQYILQDSRGSNGHYDHNQSGKEVSSQRTIYPNFPQQSPLQNSQASPQEVVIRQPPNGHPAYQGNMQIGYSPQDAVMQKQPNGHPSYQANGQPGTYQVNAQAGVQYPWNPQQTLLEGHPVVRSGTLERDAVLNRQGLNPHTNLQGNGPVYFDQNSHQEALKNMHQTMAQRSSEDAHEMGPQFSALTVQQQAALIQKQLQQKQQNQPERIVQLPLGTENQISGHNTLGMPARPVFGKIFDPAVNGFVTFSGYIFYSNTSVQLQKSSETSHNQPEQSPISAWPSQHGFEFSPEYYSGNLNFKNMDVNCLQFCVTESKNIECCSKIEEKTKAESANEEKNVKGGVNQMDIRAHEGLDEGSGEDDTSDVSKSEEETPKLTTRFQQPKSKMKDDDVATENNENDDKSMEPKEKTNRKSRHDDENTGNKKSKNEHSGDEKTKEANSQEDEEEDEVETMKSSNRKNNGDKQDDKTNQKKQKTKSEEIEGSDERQETVEEEEYDSDEE